ncbi:DUF6350 family protein [Luteimicrobium sp. NPDC057192]|uniref:cell division protein PerM n=1 Tax=Luteimicrobium sp. NPDC057192 TaxID=3346042 RepID=UPI0036432C95
MSSTGTPTRSPRARTLDAPGDDRRRGAPSELVASFLSAVVVVVECVVLTLLVVVLVVGAVLVASPTGAGWSGAATIAASTWLLGHGVPVEASGATLTIVPLGVTALALFVAFAVGRRTLRPRAAALAFAVLGYAAVVTVVAVVTGPVAPGGVLWAPVGGAMLALAGLGLGMTTRPDAPTPGELAERLQEVLEPRVPIPSVALDGVRRGAAAGVVGVLLAVAAAGVLLVVWAVSGRSTVGDVLRALDPGTASGLLLGVAQLAFVPNLVAWALAWLVGPGFAVGVGSEYAPSSHVDGALPLVPLVGALPGPGWANPVAQASVLVVVAAGVVAGVYLWRAHAFAGGTTWTGLVTSVVTAPVVAGVLVAGLEGVAGGAVGPGAMRQVGAQPWVVGGLAALWVGLGVALAVGWRLLDLRGRSRR